MTEILIPALWAGAIALLLGAVLAAASVIFKSTVDERLEKLIYALPGANCGGCGFTGCEAYARAILGENAPQGLCPVGGQKVQDDIAAALGTKPSRFVPRKALVRCGGDCEKAVIKYDYVGIADCAAAERVSSGPKGCTYGCIGYGTCVSVCKFDAIRIENCIAVIDPEKCTACGTCANSCPRNIIEMKPINNMTYINCRSVDKGSLIRKYCKAGCIGCKMCEKICPAEAIKVDGLAKIDYDKCINCGACAEKCPVKCITVVQ